MLFSSFLRCTVERRGKDVKSQKLVTARRDLCYLMELRMDRKMQERVERTKPGKKAFENKKTN